MPGVHDACDSCKSYWHSCCNCKSFTGYPTARCTIPDIEPVHDVEGSNFCEQFILGEKTQNGADKKDPDAARKKWNDLFR
jgi:hypothetical protein